jgi:hypothetical protein
MTWKKREAVTDLVILGDDEGNVKKVGGLLAAVTQDKLYPANMNYELVQKNGESIVVAGSASLSRQISPTEDVGKFLKAEFMGWGNSRNGKFKEIDVLVWEDEPTDEMKKWPRWAELQKDGSPVADEPPISDDPDDDLPF